MLIYSIVQIVGPAFVGSYPIGRREVEHRDREADAWATCEIFNRHRSGQFDQLRYDVEAVDEESPDRAPPVSAREYSNDRESVTVDMSGACLGLHGKGKTCVRPTVDGRYAVIATDGDRLVKTFDDRLHARRYNFAIHGDRLEA